MHLSLHPVSRRSFLGLAAGFVVGMVPPKPAALGRAPLGPAGREPADCVLLDAQENCVLPESIRGYESALKACGVRFVKASGGCLLSAKGIIIPACLALRQETVRDAVTALEGGALVILESGGGFTRDFPAHQRWLQDRWSLRIEPPIHLWTGSNSQFGDDRRLSIRNCHCSFLNQQSSTEKRQSPSPLAPYIDFHWPLRVKVRDFSRLVPVSAPQEHIVAWCGKWPIASKNAVGRGTLVFLGSPLGPTLRAGDTEAHRWLRQTMTELLPDSYFLLLA